MASSPTQLSPLKQRLLERMLRAEAQRQLQESPIDPREPATRVPLAPCQQQIWLHAQLDPLAPIYNETMTLHFRGELDRPALERAMEEMIQRHEIWRTTFAYVDGQVIQVIHDRLPIQIPFHDLTGVPEAGREQEATRLATADAHRPFDLGVGPLMRARLVKLNADQFRLFVVQHSLIHDGLTIYGVLMSELPVIYEAFAKGHPSPLQAPRLQYADFALWQKRFLDNSTDTQVAYWKKQLAEPPQLLDLPTDRPRPAVFSFRGAVADFTIPADLAASLRETARNEGVTPFTLMLAAFKTLMFRYTGNQDMVIGTSTDGRRRSEFQHMAGFLMNTLVLRSKPSAERTFREFLGEVKNMVLDALSNADVPMDRVVRELRWPRDPARHHVFDVTFTLEPSMAVGESNWKLTQSEVSASAAKWDLDFQLDERDGGYAVRATYCTDLFDEATIGNLFGHWLNLLDGAIKNPDARLIDLPLLSAEETEKIAALRNQTGQPLADRTISQLFDEQAARTPNAIAVESGTSSLTYAELNRKANCLARRLHAEGVGPGAVVALCVERSCEMLVAVLAVLKSGAAYLPIDPEIPKERQQFILTDSQASLLLTEESLVEGFCDLDVDIKIVYCDDGVEGTAKLDPMASSDDIAHVLYTSGSTGQPKGVEVPHKAVVNLLQSMRREPGFTSRDRMLAVTTLSFDIAGLELYLPLICGGRVTVADRNEARDPRLLRELMERRAPTVMQATPATWRALIEDGWQGSPQLKVLCGGEALPRDLTDQLLTRAAEVWNMYGPTETTIWSTIRRVGPGSGPVPIGRPIDNTQVYVLDSERRLVPDGVTGELYIGGAGVARGYLRRPELTADKFIDVAAAGRVYRTGDLARWRKDGTLECLGRADHQVKIRGFRVEIEEIEAVMREHPEVHAAAVKAWPDNLGHLSLVGYLVADADPDMRGFLRRKLPDYMIPSVFMHLDQLPLTPNLKIDRNRLPALEPGPERASFANSENETERKLAEIWESVLSLEHIGVHDDFFYCGGHSLLVAKLLNRVEQAFGRRLPMASLFEAPTVREFAMQLQNSTLPAGGARTVPIRKHLSQNPLIWLYPGAEMRETIKHLNHPFAGVALDPQEEAGLPMDFTLEQMGKQLVREIRSVQPEGPYNLGGWCGGGILAFEVASQLRREGAEVDVLILLDSVNPKVYFAMPARKRRASKIKYHLRRIKAMQGNGRMVNYLRERTSWARGRFQPRHASALESYEQRYTQAATTYDPEPYPGNVLVVRPEQSPDYRDPIVHWRDAITGDLQIQKVRGDHVSMFGEGAADIASIISSALAQAESQRLNRLSKNDQEVANDSIPAAR
jgi:amino acid adenylation domain-containing protein